jgi:hypothetical protein
MKSSPELIHDWPVPLWVYLENKISIVERWKIHKPSRLKDSCAIKKLRDEKSLDKRFWGRIIDETLDSLEEILSKPQRWLKWGYREWGYKETNLEHVLW